MMTGERQWSANVNLSERRCVLRRGRILYFLLLSGLACALTLVLMPEAPGWAASSQSPGRQTVPTHTPVPTLPPQAYLPVVLNHSGSQETFPNCRYGVAVLNVTQTNWLPTLNVGWYLDFGAHVSTGPGNVEFVQVIRIRQNKNGCTYLPGYSVTPPLTDIGLGALVAANPGALWIVGNEPDRGPSPPSCTVGAQDDTYPQVYAQAYHDVYHFIKERDATAQVAVAGLVEVTPGRLQYLDRVWQTYLQLYNTPMPVDVWNMHLYILSEALPDGQPNGIANIAVGTDPALAMRESPGNREGCVNPTDNIYCFAEHDSLTILAQQIAAMRTWMKQHGQQNKPLILSEYSQLFPFEDYDHPDNPTTCWVQDEYGKCFTPARVSNFMTRTFNYLETAADPQLGYRIDNNRLVQQWLWFSVNYHGAGSASNLVTDTLTSLTRVGQVFSSTVNNLATFIDVLPGSVANPVAFYSAPDEAVTVTLSVDVYNIGNTFTTDLLTVTFYSNADLTGVIDSQILTKSVGGCSRRAQTVTATWPNLTSGPHPYWVQVEGDAPRTQNNVVQGTILVNPLQVFLPVVLR